MIELNIHTDTLTDDECSALATFFATLGGEQGVTSANKSRDLPAKTPAPATVVEEVKEEELPDLSQDEPKEVKSDSLVEEQNELDVNGLPWDKRIHSGKPTKNADGSWKKRRGVDDATFEKVVAELKGEVAEAEQAAPDQSQVGFTQQQPDQSQVGFTQQQAQQSEQQTPAATTLTWPQVLQRMSAAGATQDTIATGMAAVGMAGRPLPELVSFPDKFETFLTNIGA